MTSEQTTIIHWFRQDLRLTDNPALYEAATMGHILPVYIFDESLADDYKMGAASRWWLHYSLQALNESLNKKIAIFRGNPEAILSSLVKQYDAKAVFWNRCYDPWQINRDKQIKQTLLKQDIQVESFNGSLLWEPWEVLKNDGTPYRVFTPFYRNGCMKAQTPRQPLPKPSSLKLVDASKMTVDSLNLLPKIKWDAQLEPHWKIGEAAAQEKLKFFLENNIHNYKMGRDFPALQSVSRLSPHLHFGEISPNQIWYATFSREQNDNTEHFCRELTWREFSYNLLYYNPDLPHKNLQMKFDAFPWRDDSHALSRWQYGKTGIPIVDAGMRELWQTGYMHNRVRMIVGSFLVKNLLLHWQHGERWFWDCLVDADLANNSASWQWVAGCGADAAPFFRIFNPVTQGQKFDPQGEYTRKYLPELDLLPDKYLFNPWEAPINVLQEANVILDETYPEPLVDLKYSRARALQAFKALKKVN